MPFEVINKPAVSAMPVTPHLTDYEAQRASFSWDHIADELDWLPDAKGERINIAYEAVDRHLKTHRRTKPAILWEGKNGEQETYTYEDLARLSSQWTNVLRSLGVQKGDRVFVFLDRIPELYGAVFGTLKAGCVIGPLFSAFGPDAVKDRMENAGAVLLLTSPDLWRKIAHIRADLPALKHVVHVQHGTRIEASEGILSYNDLMDAASNTTEIEQTGLEDRAIMHYTSGTTGKPKGAVHVHNAVFGHYATGKYVLDFHDDDVYWCTADPGWVTGTSYGMFAPFTNGVTSVIYEGGFSASKWYEIIQRYKVTVWYTAPTAIRLLMKAGDAIPKRYDLSSLRHTASVGEPLNPEAVVWGEEVIGLPFHDNWWQTETGSIMIANFPCLSVKPGSMGRPMLGIQPGIIDANGNEVPVGQEGDLALKTPWPSMFRTYWEQEERYKSCFRGEWYVSGDRARMDRDGYFWFIGRADDVINTAGHLVGPFEVESALIEHAAVAEAGVIGKPDPVAMEVVKAFVALKDGFEPSDQLRRELLGFSREKLGAGVAPREIEFVDSLPKTRSGKIMRRLLKARELGLPEGDTSTLEED